MMLDFGEDDTPPKHTLTKEELISYIPKQWLDVLTGTGIFESKCWDTIISTLNAEDTFYPKKENIFNAFKLCSPENTKVVLLGQDPYHGEGQAHGCSFSVSDKVRIPPSLKNIFKELSQEYQIPNYSPKTGNLSKWGEDGVLLLNSILTVRPHSPMSHKNIGWEVFTEKVMSYLSEKPNVVFLLLGNKARESVQHIPKIDFKTNMIAAGHPSPMNSTGSFLGSNCFRKVNDLLMSKGVKPIRWIQTE